ncbi:MULTISPECIES: L-aspartate oxidase [unclassified Lentimicrobium]|uniref:L-aspartate oxidase n=1 Tax=unclassified Lentimicrobium TaxID=2677434 RepID=UPI0015564C45|nr:MULTISPECIES: L-aspartate oxidase [unclassified Lentimicrobium]NPD44545.1 L-aspartate oxidase [Lentimicrobium sp. S6]NPD85638.1 L-aspartate oxidase [Lentimicrobium sp. L6]
MRKEIDFLVIGSGIAGLSYALKVAEKGSVLIVTKSKSDETATKYAQGGIAAVMYNPDSYEKHIEDTMNAGDYLSDPDVVRMTITESTARIKELIDWGTQFDKNSLGEYELGREGGHSEHRVLHHKDSTGLEIERALLEKAQNHPNIEIWENHFTIDIITQHHLGIRVRRKRKDIHVDLKRDKQTTDVECYGAYVYNPQKDKIHTVLAKITMVATGGLGNLYASTTNPEIATGDGIAMVYRAKGDVESMEFVQFHPTSLFNPGEKPAFLITEALRGFGGILKDSEGRAFMEDYDKRGSLAPRDIVARAIDNELKHSGEEHVFLDCTHLSKESLMNSFPKVYAKCLDLGMDISRDQIPVVPSAHYSCGGIKVDKNGKSSIKNLYASGECAATGLHGANRLASNSLLESVVFSHRAAVDSKSLIDQVSFCEGIPDWNDEGVIDNEEMVLITQSTKELQSMMSNYVGIVRSNVRLKRALDRLEIIYRETESLFDRSSLSIEICELRNLINVGYLVIKMAQMRKESIGLHFSIDYPREKA